MQKKHLITLGVAVAILAPLALMSGRKKAVSAPKQIEDKSPKITKEMSDEARREIAREYGRQGAKKSAEVRRANKAKREAAKNELSPQSNLWANGNGQKLADETPDSSPAKA